tara:strand:+ start:408 stop:1328 length:921 start_codon:yes stop_codon:yes gene_type:complete
MAKARQAEAAVVETIFQMIPHDQITRYEEQPRTHFDERGIAELAESIRENGQNTPILVTQRPGEKHYVLIGGERRWRACELLSKENGSPFMMKAVVEPYVDEDTLFSAAFIDNLHRVDMPPLDVAAGFERLRGRGKSVEQIAKLYGKSVPFVYNYLGLNGLDDRVKALMDPTLPREKRLGVTQAIEVSKITNRDLQFQVAEEAVISRMTVRDMQLAAAQQAEEMGIPLRPGKEVARPRKPSDDYEILKTFLRKTESWLDRELQRMDFSEIYGHRDDAEDEVLADTETVNRLLQKMRKLKLGIGKSL